LVRQLGRVVEPFVPAVFDTWHNLHPGCSVALQFVSDQNARRVPQALEKLTEESFGCLSVASALHEDIERMTLLIDGAPQVTMMPRLAINSSISRRLSENRKYSQTTWLMISEG
jgi:hypothetical protein